MGSKLIHVSKRGPHNTLVKYRVSQRFTYLIGMIELGRGFFIYLFIYLFIFSSDLKRIRILYTDCQSRIFVVVTGQLSMQYLTHWGRDKMADIFPDDIFKCNFLNENI